MQNLNLNVPASLIPYRSYYLERGASAQEISTRFFDIIMYFGFAPKDSLYPVIPNNVVLDPTQPLPQATEDNRPNYDAKFMEWAFLNLNKRGLPSGLTMLTTIAKAKAMLQAYMPPMEEYMTTTLPDQWARSRRYIYTLVKGIFKYPSLASPEQKSAISKLLKGRTEPNFGRAIKELTFPYGPTFFSFSTINPIRTLLVSRPNESISFDNLFLLSNFNGFPLHPPYLELPESAVSDATKLDVISNFLYNQVLSKTNFSNIITQKELSMGPQEFRIWTAQSKTFQSPEISEIIRANADLFKNYQDLISLYLEYAGGAVTAWNNVNLESASAPTQVWLKKEMNDFWDFAVWNASNSRKPRPTHLTRANLVAVYAVAASYYKFAPGLYLYFYPEHEAMISQFWEEFGEAINLLQELGNAFDDWLFSFKEIPSLEEREKAHTQAQFQLSSQICEHFATRMTDPEAIERIRLQLNKLNREAVVDGVPLLFLFDPQLPKPPASNSLTDISLFATAIREENTKALRSSLWWLDVFGMWWDALCHSAMASRLEQIIESTMPAEIKAIQYQADQVLANALQSYAAGNKLRARLVRQIAQSGLPPDMISLAQDKFNKILNDPQAVRELKRLDASVRRGELTPLIASYELQDLVDKY